MHVAETRAEMTRRCKEAARPLGLVPTMGYLHAGHMALVRRARDENATLAVSIFVNPTQFGPQEDLASYPRDLDRDLALLEEAGTDLVFVPSTEEMYPQGYDTWVEVGALAGRLEGAHRPGHFRGVATVVTRLLNIVRPERAYFGQKDGQQSVLIKRLAADLDTGVEIVVVPTVREEDGLACSSRNVYLNSQQRAAAGVIYRALSRAEALWKSGQRDAGALRGEVRRLLGSEPQMTEVEYVSVADAETLEELEQLEQVDRRAMLSVAVRLGPTRLIDNVMLG